MSVMPAYNGVERSLLECSVGDEEQDAKFLPLTQESTMPD